MEALNVTKPGNLVYLYRRRRSVVTVAMALDAQLLLFSLQYDVEV